VAKEIIATLDDPEVDWVHLGKIIGGGHGKALLKVWTKKLRHTLHYRPDPMPCGLKNKRVTSTEEE
jgi:hypothetical protein